MIDETLNEVAAAIRSRRLAGPAIFLLEMHKPLVGCLRELYGMSEPVARSIFGDRWNDNLKEILSSPRHVEKLIERLEATEKHA